MLSVQQIHVLGKGYTPTELLRYVKDEPHLKKSSDPAMWSNGIFVLFEDVNALSGKTAAHIREAIEWEELDAAKINGYTAKAIEPTYPIEIGTFKTPKGATLPLIRFVSDGGRDLYYNARLVGTMIKRVTDAGHEVRYYVNPNGMGYLRIANGEDIGLLAPYNLEPGSVIVDGYHLVNTEGTPYEGTDINAGQARPEPEPEPETAIVVAEPEPEPESEPTPETTPEPEPEPEPTPEPEEPKAKRQKKAKKEAAYPASAIPFGVRVTFAFEDAGPEEIPVLPHWILDLNDTDRLVSPRLVGVTGLGDVVCMVESLLEVHAQITDLEIDVYAESDPVVATATSHYHAALMGENVRVIREGKPGCYRFFGWDPIPDDMAIVTQIHQAVSMVARALSEGVSDGDLGNRQNAVKQFCYDHYRVSLADWRIAPSETIGEVRGLILSYADR